MVKVAVAAGHPATVDAGARDPREAGGSAADAAVAASFVSCVAETLMTGLLGGGHAIYWDARAGAARNLDFFVAVPGLGGDGREHAFEYVGVPFGEELIHYAIGPATCGVPGVPAGLDALWRAHGRLRWEQLVEPALRIAREGALLTGAHAACLRMLAPVFTMNDGARRSTRRAAGCSRRARLVEQPGLVRALELLTEEGAASAYGGTIGRALAGALRRARRERSPPPTWPPTRPTGASPLALPVPRRRRPDPRRAVRGAACARAAGAASRSLSPAERVVGARRRAGGRARPGRPHDERRHGRRARRRLRRDDDARAGLRRLAARSRPAPEQHARRDRPRPRAARPGRAHGEHDGAAARARRRRAGSCSPAVRPAARASGRRSWGCSPACSTRGWRSTRRSRGRASTRPGRVINAEPGVDEHGLAELEERGWTVRRWDTLHHYFGGVSAVTPDGAAGDPRRDGAARVLG